MIRVVCPYRSPGIEIGRFTSRADLAASMLALLDDDRYLQTTAGVITTTGNPALFQWIG